MKTIRRYKDFPIHHEREKKPVPIVGDAAIASATIGDGRMIPLILIDTSNRPDLDELIRLHEHLPPGDVEVQWGALPGSAGRVALILSFRKPIETVAILEFDITQQGILVEQILFSKVLYLQSGRPGDRYITNPAAAKIFVEVSDTGFRGYWDKLFHKHIAKEMRSRGLGRQQAKRAATEAIAEMQELGKLRMKAK